MFWQSAARGSDLAGRQGFEPRYRGPEPRVLPLDDLPVPGALARAGTSDYSRRKTAPASTRLVRDRTSDTRLWLCAAVVADDLVARRTAAARAGITLIRAAVALL